LGKTLRVGKREKGKGKRRDLSFAPCPLPFAPCHATTVLYFFKNQIPTSRVGMAHQQQENAISAPVLEIST